MLLLTKGALRNGSLVTNGIRPMTPNIPNATKAISQPQRRDSAATTAAKVAMAGAAIELMAGVHHTGSSTAGIYRSPPGGDGGMTPLIAREMMYEESSSEPMLTRGATIATMASAR